MYKSVDIGGESYRPSFHYNAFHYITIVDPSLALRTFARNFSNIDFFLKILPLKDDELVMSEM